jgi:DNA-binding winged helix-turn-helix (wHTH) protein
MTSGRCVAYKFGSFLLDLEREALLGPDGKEISLRPKSFTMLLLLVENAGRLVSQDTIMKTLWPDVFVTENNITQRIHEIRSALGPQAHQILRTRHRRGYVFAPATVPVIAGEPEISPPDVKEDRIYGADMSADTRHYPAE